MLRGTMTTISADITPRILSRSMSNSGKPTSTYLSYRLFERVCMVDDATATANGLMIDMLVNIVNIETSMESIDYEEE